jgi:hypothetical protein
MSIIAWKLKKMAGSKDSKGYMFLVIFGHFFTSFILIGAIPVFAYWLDGQPLSLLVIADLVASIAISLILTCIIYILHKATGNN